MMAQQIVTHLLGTVVILFGILCVCVAPLYIFIYGGTDGAGAEIFAITSGVVLGSALVSGGTRLLQMGRNGPKVSKLRSADSNL